MTRRYQKVEALLPEIHLMISQGKTHREIEEHFQLGGDRPIHNLLKRQRRKTKKGEPPKSRGRKPAITLQEYKHENKRLKMENELLRDFLHAVGKR
ncbi:imidazolonepropionase [Desulforamulus ruminis]|uniref:imidazolonepropionase n=1 Tax=Desulforamulus ruminis TaxID=1564 RepID=UPI002FD91A89